MIDFYFYLLPFAAGAGIGWFYFGGLWWTMQQLPTARHPALLVLGSFIGRSGLSLLGFYLVANGSWQRLLVCVLGFFLMRLVLVRYWQPEPTEET